MNKNTPNIVLDFSANKTINDLTAGQPLAILPADLAKKLLGSYAKQLVKASKDEIIEFHVEDLRKSKDIPHAVQLSIEFIQERELIANVCAENWDIYAVEPTITGPVKMS